MFEILKKFTTGCEVASTTIDLEKPLVKDGDANDVDVYLYRSMNGSLMYLTASRPDIMFAAFGNSSEIHHLTSNAYTMIEEYARATQDRKTTIGGCHFVENSTICIIENPVQHSKTKHIEIRLHFIRDCTAKKLIQMVKIDTKHNVADLLRKGFDAGRFQ
ncbi:retrovirus-related pol polyprotein from transposon TNT 1-94 [Tanacetum coccineum]